MYNAQCTMNIAVRCYQRHHRDSGLAEADGHGGQAHALARLGEAAASGQLPARRQGELHHHAADTQGTPVSHQYRQAQGVARTQGAPIGLQGQAQIGLGGTGSGLVELHGWQGAEDGVEGGGEDGAGLLGAHIDGGRVIFAVGGA